MAHQDKSVEEYISELMTRARKAQNQRRVLPNTK
jgi:hypothetical protein